MSNVHIVIFHCTADYHITDIQRRLFGEEEPVESLLYLISVSRNVERIADYATNIAEDVFYLVNAQIIRHFDPEQSLENLDDNAQ